MSIYTIHARNVNDAFTSALFWLKTSGMPEQSRNGSVIVAPGPVFTESANPMERVLFNPERHANPYFHFMEGLWLLAGSDSVEWIAQYNARMREYSDDSKTLHGAYGRRLRGQVGTAIEMLRKDPTSRRVVLQIWRMHEDLSVNSKDLPCNTQIYLDMRDNVLNLTTMARSNDVWWGAFGANYVHFSMLQEYIASKLRSPIGVLRQMSHNLHVYPELAPQWASDQLRFPMNADLYRYKVRPMPMIQDPTVWDLELMAFFDNIILYNFKEPFFSHVAVPMRASWAARKAGDTGRAQAEEIVADDWREACLQWLDHADQVKEEAQQ